MQLNKLIEHVSYESVHGSPAIQITDLCYDSRKAKPGCMFVCIRGTQSDGHDYVYRCSGSGGHVAVVVDERAYRVRCCKPGTFIQKTERMRVFDTLCTITLSGCNRCVVPRSRLALRRIIGSIF